MLNIALSNPSSVAGVIVSTVTGAKTSFDKCQSYINNVNKAIGSLTTQCKKKCTKWNTQN